MLGMGVNSLRTNLVWVGLQLRETRLAHEKQREEAALKEVQYVVEEMARLKESLTAAVHHHPPKIVYLFPQSVKHLWQSPGLSILLNHFGSIIVPLIELSTK